MRLGGSDLLGADVRWDTGRVVDASEDLARLTREVPPEDLASLCLDEEPAHEQYLDLWRSTQTGGLPLAITFATSFVSACTFSMTVFGHSVV